MSYNQGFNIVVLNKLFFKYLMLKCNLKIFVNINALFNDKLELRNEPPHAKVAKSFVTSGEFVCFLT